MRLTLIIKYWISLLIKPLKTDILSFKITTETDDEDIPWSHTDIIINGKSLFEKLRDYEVSEARRTRTDTKLVGKYIGIDPSDLYSLYRKTGRKTTDNYSAWQCSDCRSFCSSHLYCTYKVGLFFVYLNNFRQVATHVPFSRTGAIHEVMREKTKWNYKAFQSFKFSKFQFYKALASLK